MVREHAGFRPGALAELDALAGWLTEQALEALAGEVARRQPSPATRWTYAGIYRAFCASLDPDAGPEALRADRVRAWRDSLEAHGRAPARSPSTSRRSGRSPTRSTSTRRSPRSAPSSRPWPATRDQPRRV
jgi:hypothetical protein